MQGVIIRRQEMNDNCNVFSAGVVKEVMEVQVRGPSKEFGASNEGF